MVLPLSTICKQDNSRTYHPQVDNLPSAAIAVVVALYSYTRKTRSTNTTFGTLVCYNNPTDESVQQSTMSYLHPVRIKVCTLYGVDTLCMPML